MTTLKQEAFALIESIPDDKSDVLIKIVKNIREVLGINSNSRAERNLAIMDEIQKLVGDDIPWANEEEMIKELAEMRRQRLRS
ncbi:MAG: hypothetical protein IJP68_07830 [Selenomonadaceae bacterium]|nr:hypothetical protein [Selenomonadaceae bacterium]